MYEYRVNKWLVIRGSAALYKTILREFGKVAVYKDGKLARSEAVV